MRPNAGAIPNIRKFRSNRVGIQTQTRDDKLPLGIRIAGLRKVAGLTLTQLARACDLSEATLSRIENGRSQVSAHHLFLLAQVLGVDIADFFRQDAKPLLKGMRSITRKGDGARHSLARYVSEVLNADLSRKDMHPAINHIRAKTLDEVGGYSAHNGEEFLYVLNGSIALHTDIYTPTILNTGDCMYFEGSMNHAYLNAADGVATILVVVGPGGEVTT